MISINMKNSEFNTLNTEVVLRTLKLNAVSVGNIIYNFHYRVKHNNPIIILITHLDSRRHLLCLNFAQFLIYLIFNQNI